MGYQQQLEGQPMCLPENHKEGCQTEMDKQNIYIHISVKSFSLWDYNKNCEKLYLVKYACAYFIVFSESFHKTFVSLQAKFIV